MKAVIVQRVTLEPKEIAELTVLSNVIQQGRVSLSLNEGDLKCIQLVKGKDFDVIQVGDLDNIKKVHTFVRGAKEIYELGGVYPYQISEEKIAEAVVAQIRKLGDIDLVLLSPVEQDSGRNGLPGLLAGKLNWDLYNDVQSLKVEGDQLVIEQCLEEGVQTLQISRPSVLTSFEGCEIGDDPSDQYDLVEKLEKKETVKIALESLVSKVTEAKINSLVLPKDPESQPVRKLDDQILGEVITKIKERI